MTVKQARRKVLGIEGTLAAIHQRRATHQQAMADYLARYTETGDDNLYVQYTYAKERVGAAELDIWKYALHLAVAERDLAIAEKKEAQRVRSNA